jgi:hypothetical protein
MEITYPHCLFAILGQTFRSFASLKERYRSVLYVAEGHDFQVCSTSSEECVLSQTLSSARTRLFSRLCRRLSSLVDVELAQL